MKKESLKKYVFSILLALYAVVPTLNQMLVRIYPNTMGMMYTTLYLSSLVLLVLAFLGYGFKIKKISVSALCLLVAIVAAYMLTRLSPFESLLKPYFFFIFTICSFIIPLQLDVNPKLFVSATMIIPSFGILFSSRIFELSWRGTIHMDTSYSFLLPIVSTVFYIAYYWKKEKKPIKLIMTFFILVNAYYFYNLIFHGSRAPTLSIVLSIIFVYIVKKYNGRPGFRFDKGKSFVMSIPIILIVLNFSSLLMEAGKFATESGIEAGTIQKSISLVASNNLEDGRDNVAADAMEGISRSPIVGNGLSTSLESINQVHPHNFVLQLLHDGGIILTLFFMIPMLVYLKKWKLSCTDDGFILISLFFFAAVVGALFSLDMWMNSRLWMFMGFLLRDDMYYNRSILSKKQVIRK